jgi:hypothetical protein
MTEHLYEITDALVHTIDDIMENGGELTEELEKRFDKGQLDFKDKAANIIRYELGLDGDAEAVKKEIARLQTSLRSIENRKEWMRGYLKRNMEATGITEIKHPLLPTISIAKNPPSVKIVDENILLAGYVEIRPTTHVDKKAILVALKAGKEVSGAILVDDKTNLRVK